ncbi:MAG: hypothetical protein E3J72_00815 [Planctomycetota bacterium]|nr:MAG: hypothetical protein E3J72_00815 [Planctomycetota bacterium]
MTRFFVVLTPVLLLAIAGCGGSGADALIGAGVVGGGAAAAGGGGGGGGGYQPYVPGGTALPQASNPNPADSAASIPVTQQLSWDAAPGATKYGVYFGTISPGSFMGNQSGTSFNPGQLDHGTTYYWRIDSSNSYGTTTGVEWSFRVTTGGSLAWAKSATGGASDYGYGVSALPDGSVIITGLFYSDNVTFGEGEGNETVLTSTGDIAFFIAKYNPDGTLAWAKGDSAAGRGGAIGRGICTLPDGSSIVIGEFACSTTFGVGEGNETSITSSVGGWDIFIAKYNPDGTLAWAKSAGGTMVDDSVGISILPDNTAIIIGTFQNTATFGNASEGGSETVLASAGDVDLFIAKYNSDGTLAWAKSAGGVSADVCTGISTLSDGSAFVTGYIGGTATFGNASEGNETVLSSARFFIAKYNPDGTLAWAKGENYADGGSISTLPDGSAIVTGYFDGTATFGAGEGNETSLTSSAGSYDIFIAKYNPDSTLAWAKSAGGDTDWDRSHGISTLSDGSAFLTGYFGGTATFGNASEGGMEVDLTTTDIGYDIFIARYNPDGTLAWAKKAGGPAIDRSRSICTLSDGTAIITGNFESTATFGAGEDYETVLTSAGSYDIFIAKFNP